MLSGSGLKGLNRIVIVRLRKVGTRPSGEYAAIADWSHADTFFVVSVRSTPCCRPVVGNLPHSSYNRPRSMVHCVHNLKYRSGVCRTATPLMLIVTRRTGYWADWIRAYKILIDGNKVGKIRTGEELKFNLDEGSHSIKFTIDWCSSKELTFDIKLQDKPIEVECWPGCRGCSLLFALYFITFGRKHYISARMKS